MTLKKLYDPKRGKMRVAGLMSGSGTNLVKIIDEEMHLNMIGESPYHVAVIFTDNPASCALSIGRVYGIPVIVNDIKAFYKNKGQPLKNLEIRKEFDLMTAESLYKYDISTVAYAGYMSIATAPLTKSFLGINVHPADLSVKNPDGTRKYTGDHAVRDAILAGERYICSTTHLVEERVDYGGILMLSEPVHVVLPKKFDKNNSQLVKEAEKLNQNRLKERGDWVIFPKTLLDVAQGRFSKDNKGRLYYDGKHIPNGLKTYFSELENFYKFDK